MTTRVFRSAAALMLVLMAQAVVVAHDIPDEIAVQSYVKPEQGQLQVLLRVPLLAVAEANLPKDGTGYLALAYVDTALREAANQISNGIVFLEGDERLTRYEMANARISLPSDRSFDSFEGALARVRGARLPDATQVYYNQGFLDLELHFPIRSQDSPFSMRVLFGRGLANRTATYINFIRPDGGVRAFRIHDDTPLVRLDPQAHQAAWVFLKAGFYRFLDGLDHLLFVIVLALPFRRARDLVKPFAAFAIAHSITLGLAAFGLATVGHVVRAHDWCAHRAVARLCGDRERHRRLDALGSACTAGLSRSCSASSTVSASRSHCRRRCSSRDRIRSRRSSPITSASSSARSSSLPSSLPAANLLFTQVVPERAGIIVASVLVGHAGWHWLTERFAIAQLSSWPMMDLRSAAHARALVACAHRHRRSLVVRRRFDQSQARRP